ncbi:LRRN4 C-terminal-like protein [Engraulis encrasicolus]|uniref:LRRN4 C-terminal-like protein n=1 Tax=Engraulis encrasicolus TaxID=184585 RepID=UPI002FCF297B
MLILNASLLLLRLPVIFLCLSQTISAGDAPIHLVFGDDETPATTTDSIKPEVTRGVVEAQICDYDLCVAQMETCFDIATRTGCLCPGLTPEFVPPNAPEVKGVNPGASGQVIIHWCAPFSSVSQYKVTVEGNEGSHVFNSWFRNASLANVRLGQRICVQAMNSAGASTLSEESCSTYRVEKQANTSLVSGVIAGGVVFILLLCLTALILWRRKGLCRGGSDGGEGLGNPSFNDGTM